MKAYEHDHQGSRRHVIAPGNALQPIPGALLLGILKRRLSDIVYRAMLADQTDLLSRTA